MGIEYVNRRGERYYLLQGKTKTGKPKYYVSRKAEGVPVEQMPEGYELHENRSGGPSPFGKFGLHACCPPSASSLHAGCMSWPASSISSWTFRKTAVRPGRRARRRSPSS